MTPATACRLAGPGARIVTRRRGVLHVYVGPTTPSGQFVPRRHRTVCRTHTGQLRVLGTDTSPGGKRMCLRCSACLAPRSGQAELSTREEWQARFAHVTFEQLITEAVTATDLATLDTVGHLSLLLFGHRPCNRPIADTASRAPLHDILGGRRQQLTSPDGISSIERQFRDLRESTANARRGEREEIYKQIEARKDRLGLPLAKH